jgi:hypothetical protein
MRRYDVESDKKSKNLFKRQFLMHHSYVLFKISVQNVRIKILILKCLITDVSKCDSSFFISTLVPF